MVRVWWFDHGLSKFPASSTKEKPNQVLTVPEVMLDDAGWAKLGAPHDRFAAMLSGLLMIYEAGYYDFWTNSDDGSHVYIDGLMAVNNGGLHGPVKTRGTMHLSHGFHSIMVDFFKNREESTNFARACGANKDGPCPTFQSSTTHGGDAARGDNNAGLSGQWNSGACTHTAAENNPWWLVHLEQQVEVTSLTIVGRSDCCSERTQGFAVC